MTLALNAGDQLILYRDGVIEAASPDGAELRVEGIVQALPAFASSRDTTICRCS
jgi:serine phosphatase RsbU (regulator of sigma subunit)